MIRVAKCECELVSQDSVRSAPGRVPRRARGRHSFRGVGFWNVRKFKGGFYLAGFPINSFALTRVRVVEFSARVGWVLRTKRVALVSVWPFGAPYSYNSSAYFIMVLRVRCLWFPSSDRLQTWFIPSGTTRSQQQHESTIVWHNLPPYDRFWYFILSFSSKRAWQRGSKHYQRWIEGRLRQTMVDS